MSDIKYTAEGQRVQVLATLPGGKFLVAGQIGSYQDDEEWFDTDHPDIVAKLFDTAPVAIHERRVAELQAEVASLESRHAQLTDEIHTAEQVHKQRLRKLAKYEPLARIEDFIDGKITHYVISDDCYQIEETGHYRLKISTPQSEKSGDEAYSRELKLLALYGKTDRSVEWRLNYYSDGSGSRSHFCWPCTSAEEASGLAARLFEEACRKIVANKQQARCADYLLQSARAIGVAPPEWVEPTANKSRLEYAQKQVADAQRALDGAKAQLQVLQQ